MKVTIQCKQVVTYYQDIDLTKEEFKLLKPYDGGEIDERSDREVYNLLTHKLNHADVFDSESEYTDVFIRISRKPE